MSTNRTDIHSPVHMDPEAYEYTFAYDSQASGELVGIMSTEEGRAWWSEIRQHMAKVHGSCQCDHCGAHIRYIAILKHLPTGTYIEVGETCLDNRFALASKAEFDALRKAAALDREAQRIKAEVNANLLAMAATQPVEVINFLGDRKGENDPKGIAYPATDIRRKFWTYGSISERQVAFVAKLVAEVAEKAQKAAERSEEAKLGLLAIPEGKVSVRGLVVKTETRYTDYGAREVMTVKVSTPEGIYLAWGSEPTGLNVEKGDEVVFSATFEAKDEGFATFKRPTKASVVFSDAQLERDLAGV